MISIKAIDHLVIVVQDVQRSLSFYQQVLGMTAQQEGERFSLSFGQQKLNLQTRASLPEMAQQTTAGSANFCLLTHDDIASVVAHLAACKVDILAGPVQRQGATGPLQSVYFYDPDGNLVEVARPHV